MLTTPAATRNVRPPVSCCSVMSAQQATPHRRIVLPLDSRAPAARCWLVAEMIRSVAILGAGTMGAQIAAHVANAGTDGGSST